jgi:hypothetical protein
MWGTPAANDANKTPHCEINSKQAGLVRSVGREELKNRPESWATPSASNPNEGETLESWNARQTKNKAKHRNGNGAGTPLAIQIKQQDQWATPRCSMAQDKQEDSGKRRLGEQAQHNTGGKLNSRWVETLMNLPVGWTMPSCTSPVTIAQKNCASLETESSQQQQS